jgi:uncharacterized membrane protein
LKSPDLPPSDRKLYVRCPIDFRPRNVNGRVFGVERVTRHPALWFLGLGAAGGALYTLSPVYSAAGGFFLLFSFIGSAHTDYRYRRGNGGLLTQEQELSTSNIPFLALLSGSQQWMSLAADMKWTNAAIASALTLAVAARRFKK